MKKVLLIAVAVGLILASVSTAQGKDFVVEVKKDRVNLRAGGSMAHKIIAKLERGTRLVAAREIGDWYKVRIPKSVPVYISGKASYVTLQDSRTGVIKASRLNIRVSPSTQYSIVGVVDRNATVRILGRTEGWLKIQPPHGALAWVYKPHLRKIGGASVSDVSSSPSVGSVPTYASPSKSKARPVAQAMDTSKLALIYRNALTRWEAGDMAAAKTLLTEVTTSGKGSSYESVALMQLGVIARIEADQKAQEARQRDIVMQRLRLDEECQKKMMQIAKDFMEKNKKKAVAFTAEGFFQSMGMYFGRRGTHKLVNKKGIETYHLRGKGVDLYDSRYYGKKVGVIGKVIDDPSAAYKIIEVEKVVIIKK